MPVLTSHAVFRKLLTVFWSAVAAMGVLPTAVSAGDTLARVRSAGVVRCGVNNGLEGFAVKDEAGRWSGMDVDFCRAAAAAVLGDSEKAVFTPLMASARFPVLKSKQIDLLLRRTTWTFGREAGLQVHFAGTLYYDGQGFMVARSGAARALPDLDGAAICLVKGTTHEQNLDDFFKAHGLAYRPLAGESTAAAM